MRREVNFPHQMGKGWSRNPLSPRWELLALPKGLDVPERLLRSAPHAGSSPGPPAPVGTSLPSSGWLCLMQRGHLSPIPCEENCPQKPQGPGSHS